MMTNGDYWRQRAERLRNIPLRTLADVQETLRLAKRQKADVAMARAMLKFGRLTDEAREYVAREYDERIAQAYPQDRE